MHTAIEIIIHQDRQGQNIMAAVRQGNVDGGLILASIAGRYIRVNDDNVASIIGNAVTQYLRDLAYLGEVRA